MTDTACGALQVAVDTIVQGFHSKGSIRELIAAQKEHLADLQKLILAQQEHVRVPTWKPRDGGKDALIVYTDLEPDDVFTILAIRKERERLLAAPPVIVFTVEPVWKDSGQILGKKLVMAAAALGVDFVINDMVMIDNHAEGTEPEQLEHYRKDALKRVHEAASAGGDVDWLMIAPGRGNLVSLMGQVDDDIARRSAVMLYSGSFNTRACTGEDVAKIAALVARSERAKSKRGNACLVDAAQFVFTNGKDTLALQSLAELCPSIGTQIAEVNPFFGEAWRLFSCEFDGNLIRPSHPRLWDAKHGKDGNLNDMEKAMFKELKEIWEQGDVQGYAEKLLASPLFKKIVMYKHATVRALANNSRDGPLCDILCYLNPWLYASSPQDVVLRTGLWNVHPTTGHTNLDDSKGLCPAISHQLKDPEDTSVHSKLRTELTRIIMSSVSVQEMEEGIPS